MGCGVDDRQISQTIPGQLWKPRSGSGDLSEVRTSTPSTQGWSRSHGRTAHTFSGDSFVSRSAEHLAFARTIFPYNTNLEDLEDWTPPPPRYQPDPQLRSYASRAWSPPDAARPSIYSKSRTPGPVLRSNLPSLERREQSLKACSRGRNGYRGSRMQRIEDLSESGTSACRLIRAFVPPDIEQCRDRPEREGWSWLERMPFTFLAPGDVQHKKDDTYLDDIRTGVIHHAGSFFGHDKNGDTILHAFIRHIEPHTMSAEKMQETLEEIVRKTPASTTGMRNANGLTPLHLACKLAFPYVVATLLRFVGRRGSHDDSDHSMDSGISRSTAPGDTAPEHLHLHLREAIAVAGDDRTCLLEDTRRTYWEARNSEALDALYIEADALVCHCLISDAMVG
ncbi:hypothetical protein BCR34DRAFT_60317 [Clohesyomyces aquaticus]|uniref:Ankyrin repeat-containing domain protein n=1 Tax=Clohesyomyces aquaticus TaxID=1231657 RepID=A0A1Y2A445_9PLEO|nr:hypothetical protein BCR34DRAFT_60317 [Clohesyomyces aquaticus]